jgi:hypothetical protein
MTLNLYQGISGNSLVLKLQDTLIDQINGFFHNVPYNEGTLKKTCMTLV